MITATSENLTLVIVMVCGIHVGVGNGRVICRPNSFLHHCFNREGLVWVCREIFDSPAKNGPYT